MNQEKLLQTVIGVGLILLLSVGCSAPATPAPPTLTPTPVEEKYEKVDPSELPIDFQTSMPDENRVRLVISEAYQDAGEHKITRLRDVALQAITIAGGTAVRSGSDDSAIPTLTIDLKGNALGADYSSIGYRYTGAHLQGHVSVSRGPVTLYEGVFQCTSNPGQYATELAASHPKDAPFDDALCEDFTSRLIEALAAFDHVDKKAFLADIVRPVRELPRWLAKPENRDWLLIVSAVRMLIEEADETTIDLVVPFIGWEWYLGEDSALDAIRGRLPLRVRTLLPQAIVSFVRESGKWNEEYELCLREADVPVDVVVPLLEHPDSGVRFHAAVVIATKGDPRAWVTLLDAAQGRTEGENQSLTEYDVDLRKEEAVEVLRELAELAPDAEVRAKAKEILNSLGRDGREQPP